MGICVGTFCNLKPYPGFQFITIAEFPEIREKVAQEMPAALSGAKSVEDALAATHVATDQIMSKVGYY